MVKKLISRKKFIVSTITGITGIGLINRTLKAVTPIAPVLRSIGNTGLWVTPLCFGAPRTNEVSLIRYALDKGINFIDTGRSYSNGNNERLVGEAIAGIRKNVVIQSKIHLYWNELPSKGKGKKGAEEIRTALSSKLEASLKALNTDYIDIMLYHDAVDETLLFHPETLKFFSEMKKSGTIKINGFSTHNDYMNLPARNNSENFYDVFMVPFNHKGSFVHSVTGNFSEWDQEKLEGIIKEAYNKGIGVIAMKTCSGGKYSPSPQIDASFREAVKWVLQKKYISSAAIAMSSFEQVDEHITLLNEL
jgi:aryl-alcohol dehydrogenase-like predicted oxidoreductase